MIDFVKMHGSGNDFVMVDQFSGANQFTLSYPEAARKLCDRNFGIGADGLILVLPSAKADFQMRIFNPDGSEAEMCGNGIRCFAKLVFDKGYTKDAAFTVETLAGIRNPLIVESGNPATLVEVKMGEPRLDRSQIPMLGPEGRVVDEVLDIDVARLRVTCVNMGNPHCVTFVDDVTAFDVETIGPFVEENRAFPEHTNAEFVEVISKDELKMRVWERGAGETLACGTGASASVVAAVLNGLTDRKVTVHLLGGNLLIDWRESDNVVKMTGPAEQVFTGQIEL